MPRNISFDGFRVEWVEFRVDPDNPARARFRIHGVLVNNGSDEMPRTIEGWAGIPAGTRNAVESALRTLLLQRAAIELGIDVSQATTLLTIQNGVIRPA